NIFENIRKSIFFLLASNLGELITVLLSVLLFWPSPLMPLHILWINLITDSFPALALGLDPGSPGIMNRRPRPANQNLFAQGGAFTVVLYGVVIAAVTLFAFKFTHVTTGDLKYAQTMALVVLAGSQLIYSIVVRAGVNSIFRVNHLSNLFLLGAIAIGVALQLLILYIPPVASLFGTVALSLQNWGLVLALSLVPLVVHEIVVLIRRVFSR
ncbi:MAG: cation transporting ATPase C-terminal domain-containing protein, partial [Clostridia bacterium]